jgi:malate dehydrogenase
MKIIFIQKRVKIQMTNKKVGIVGVGAVGATAAYTLALNGICNEIVLYDIADGVARGKSIDISQASYYTKTQTNIYSVDTLNDMKDCDIVVITAGVPRKGDMTRADLLLINANIIKDVTTSIAKSSPNAIIICVSNPLDVMTYVIQKLTSWDRKRIIGMAGALDGARMAYQISQKTGLNMNQIGSLVLGDHGENMIPMPSEVSIGDVPLKNILSDEDFEEIIQKTKKGGAEIVSHLGTSGYYGPGRAIAHMVESILDDNKTIVPSSVCLSGEYGHENVCVGVPIILGKNGVEKIIEIELNDKTKDKLQISVDSIKESIKILEDNNFF